MAIVTTLADTGREILAAVRTTVSNRLRSKYVALRYRGHPAASPVTLPWQWNDKPNRIALVNLLLHDRVAGDYLEIGCDTDVLFNSVAVAHRVGVDPARGGTVRKKSDDFFAGNTKRFDVVWVDGLHTYDQAHRDIVNALAVLKPGGWIGIHDMLPRNWVEAHVPRLIPDGAWSGDVWKVCFELVAATGLEFRIVNIDRGVGVIRATAEQPSVPDLSGKLDAATFSYLADHVGELPVIEWDAAFAWITTSKHQNGQVAR
jgi:hypothetical protein